MRVHSINTELFNFVGIEDGVQCICLNVIADNKSRLQYEARAGYRGLAECIAVVCRKTSVDLHFMLFAVLRLESPPILLGVVRLPEAFMRLQVSR